jgi:hypothetical protein
MKNNTIELIKMKVEILKLKANDYEWNCHVPADVKDELEQVLMQINNALQNNKDEV